MPPARGRGKGRGRPGNNGAVTDNAGNGDESATPKTTDQSANQETAEMKDDAENETNKEKTKVTEDTTVDKTMNGTSVSMETPGKSTEEITDIVKDTADNVTKEGDGKSKNTSAEISKDETTEITQVKGEEDDDTEAAMDTTEQDTKGVAGEITNATELEGEFEDIIKEIDTFESMAKLKEDTAKVSSKAEEEENATAESETSPELEGDAATKKYFKIEITTTSNLKPLDKNQKEDMLRNQDWRFKKFQVKLPVGEKITSPFVEQLNNMNARSASYSFKMRENSLPIFANGFLVFNTYEDRAKGASFVAPIVQKTAARLQLKYYVKPTAAMATMSANGDNCLHLNNVPENTTIRQLKGFFPQAREIGMPVTKSGKSLGYAVLYFKSKVAAEVVLKYNREVIIGTSVLSLQKMYMSTELATNADKCKEINRNHFGVSQFVICKHGATATQINLKIEEKSIPQTDAKQVKQNTDTEKVLEDKTGNTSGPMIQAGTGQKSIQKDQSGPSRTGGQQKRRIPGGKGREARIANKQKFQQTGQHWQKGQGPKFGPQGMTGPGQQWQKGQGPKGGPQGMTGPGQQWQKGQGPKGGPQGMTGFGQGGDPQMQNRQQEGQQKSNKKLRVQDWKKRKNSSQGKKGPGQRGGPQMQNRQQGGQQNQYFPNPQWQPNTGGTNMPSGFGIQSSGVMANFASGGREQFSPARGNRIQPRQMAGSFGQNSGQMGNFRAGANQQFSPSRSGGGRQGAGGAPATYGRDGSGGGANRGRNYSGRRKGPSYGGSRVNYEREPPGPDLGDLDKLQGIMTQQLNKMKQQMEQTLKKQLKDQLREIREAGNKRNHEESAYQSMSPNAGKRQRMSESPYYAEDDTYARGPVGGAAPRGSGPSLNIAPQMYGRPENVQRDLTFQELSGYDPIPRQMQSRSFEDNQSPMGSAGRRQQSPSGMQIPQRLDDYTSPLNYNTNRSSTGAGQYYSANSGGYSGGYN